MDLGALTYGFGLGAHPERARLPSEGEALNFIGRELGAQEERKTAQELDEPTPVREGTQAVRALPRVAATQPAVGAGGAGLPPRRASARTRPPP